MISLRRLGPGAYETLDGRFNVTKLWSDGYGWSWFIHDTADRTVMLDPTGTLADAKLSIEAQIGDVIPVATNADGSAVCRHRDLSVCPSYATDPRYVDVVGAHFWIPDEAERAAVLAELAAV